MKLIRLTEDEFCKKEIRYYVSEIERCAKDDIDLADLDGIEYCIEATLIYLDKLIENANE